MQGTTWVQCQINSTFLIFEPPTCVAACAATFCSPSTKSLSKVFWKVASSEDAWWHAEWCMTRSRAKPTPRASSAKPDERLSLCAYLNCLIYPRFIGGKWVARHALTTNDPTGQTGPSVLACVKHRVLHENRPGRLLFIQNVWQNRCLQTPKNGFSNRYAAVYVCHIFPVVLFIHSNPQLLIVHWEKRWVSPNLCFLFLFWTDILIIVQL